MNNTHLIARRRAMLMRFITQVVSSHSSMFWLVELIWGLVNHKSYICNCHGQFLCSLWRTHGNFSEAFLLWAIKKCFPAGKSHLPKGKMVSVTTAIAWGQVFLSKGAVLQQKKCVSQEFKLIWTCSQGTNGLKAYHGLLLDHDYWIPFLV